MLFSKLNLSSITDGLKEFGILERLIAGICLFIPILLSYAEGCKEFLPSISHYVYMDKNRHIFGMLMTTAALLFIFNGALYIRKNETLSSRARKDRGYWNILAGLALIGVILVPLCDESTWHNRDCYPYSTLHFIFAAIFIGVNILLMAFSYKGKLKAMGPILAGISVVALLACWQLEKFTLLHAEWVCLGCIGIHYIWISCQRE